MRTFTRTGTAFAGHAGEWQVWIRSASMPHKAFELWATSSTRERAAEVRDDLQGYGGYLVELRHSSDKYKTPSQLDREIAAATSTRKRKAKR